MSGKGLQAAGNLISESENGPAGFVPSSPEEVELNRRVNRKMDFAMLPLLSLVYLFNGLDKGNIGNAQTQGFTKDIGAQPEDLNFAVSLFFITFVLFQPPSAAMGRWVGPNIWIPFLAFSWGALTIGQAFIKGRGGLIAIRLVIGLFEAGFYPTCVSYLSFFYGRFDLAVRVAIFYGQYAVAGAFSGAISYGVFHLKSGPLRNWQYLFVIEGSLTCFVAILAFCLLPRGPSSAWFLNQEEREFAADRMRRDTALFIQHEYGKDGLEKDRLSKRDAIEAAKDWKFYGVILFNICASVPTQAFSIFLPLVLQGLGFESIRANLLTVPPYVCGAIGLYLFALSSDRRRERGYHIIASLFIGIIGLILTVTVKSSGGKYAGLCILLFGCYVSAPLTVAWLSGNTPEPGKRTLILGANGFGNLAGIIGSQIFAAKYGPSYKTSFYVSLGIAIVALLGYTGYRFGLAAANRYKRGKMAQMTEEELERERTDKTRYGDRKYTFIYGL
ncbi:major facilitator superfamily domain-containing protein [Mariannaea sp. PMI_226]|nr:major facilitator superfamily domain-containing protein [Mariannaea sp. PMI_226]